MGISLKRFDGWEPSETHTYRYSRRDPGRVTSVKVVREVEWDADERAWMLALHLYRSQVGPCGHYLPRTAAADAEYRYFSPEPDRCHACTAIGEQAKAYTESPQPQALLFHAERK